MLNFVPGLALRAVAGGCKIYRIGSLNIWQIAYIKANIKSLPIQ